MYATNIDGQVINLAVSGKLWRRSLVMIDEETQTLWSQLLAKGMEGKLEGRELEMLPSVITDWQSWRKSHPKTTVLKMSRTAKKFKNDVYKNPERYVLGITRSGKSKAWSFKHLNNRPLINDQFKGQSVVVYYEQKNGAAYLYESTLHESTAGDSELTFKLDGDQVVDTATNSIWDLTTGRAISGSHQGKSLTPLPAIPSFVKAWKNFYPDSEFWEPK